MNGKKAKSLRRTAEARTVTQEKVEYKSYAPPVFMQLPSEKTGKVEVGTPFTKVQKGIPREMENSCTRFMYKKLKKAS